LYNVQECELIGIECCAFCSPQGKQTISYKACKFLLSEVFQIDVVFQGSPAQTTVAQSYASLSDQF
jgi:hypothetical protein